MEQKENPIDKTVSKVSSVFSTSKVMNVLLMLASAGFGLFCLWGVWAFVFTETSSDRFLAAAVLGVIAVICFLLFRYGYNRRKKFK